MAWREEYVCTECGAEAPDFAHGLPEGPCQEGSGACCIVRAILWEDDPQAPAVLVSPPPSNPFGPAPVAPRQGAGLSPRPR